jgi:hypothetical protein
VLCRLDLKDIKVVTKLGGTVDDSELVHGAVFDHKAAKAAGGPTRVEHAKIALVQFHISPPKTDLENNVIISDYAQARLFGDGAYALFQAKHGACTNLLASGPPYPIGLVIHGFCMLGLRTG